MADSVKRPLTERCPQLTDFLAACVGLKRSNISFLIVQIMSNSDPPSLTNAGMKLINCETRFSQFSVFIKLAFEERELSL